MKFGLQLSYQNFLTRGSLEKSFKEFLNELLEGFAGDGITLGNVNGVKYRKRVKVNRRVDNEYTMVTVMVLATGHHLIPKKTEKGKKYFDSLAVLQTLQHIPRNQIQVIY